MILFLDFDGVLHPEGCEPARYFCRLALLENFCRGHAKVDVVVSSSWRRTRNLVELRSIFSEDLRGRVIGATPCFEKIETVDSMETYPRHSEIIAWLRDRKIYDQSWVALDDQPAMFKPFTKNLIKIDPRVGITRAVITELERRYEPFTSQ